MELGIAFSVASGDSLLSNGTNIMIRLLLQEQTLPITAELKWRYRFSLLTVLFTGILLSWGAVVTSIEAGLAVPDWPTTFNSIDPIKPIPRWWAIPSVLAEHGHRLMGMVVGASTLILFIWTLITESRKWVKVVAGLALLLVVVQGILGGLRVVLISLDLAVVHACVAQLFFSTLIALTFFTSSSWLKSLGILQENSGTTLFRKLALITTVAIYIQIILGALLRHPGSGANLVLVTTHLLGAFIVVGLILITAKWARKVSGETTLIPRFSSVLSGALGVQFLLGLLAYWLITIDEASGRGVWPTIVSTLHLITGAVLLSSCVLLVLASARSYAASKERVL